MIFDGDAVDTCRDKSRFIGETKLEINLKLIQFTKNVKYMAFLSLHGFKGNICSLSCERN